MRKLATILFLGLTFVTAGSALAEGETNAPPNASTVPGCIPVLDKNSIIVGCTQTGNCRLSCGSTKKLTKVDGKKTADNTYEPGVDDAGAPQCKCVPPPPKEPGWAERQKNKIKEKVNEVKEKTPRKIGFSINPIGALLGGE